MRFVRVTVNLARNRVVSVMEQDTPFQSPAGTTVDGEECETYDLGAVEDQEWRDGAGRPCGLTRHLLERLERGDADVRRLHDVPCTLEGLRSRLRERGPSGVPVGVRAWLATVLPPEQATAMGLVRGLPISALKACEALRAARDPHGGSRLAYFERAAHEQASRRAGKELRRRRVRAEREAAQAVAAAEAWDEMRASIERAPGG